MQRRVLAAAIAFICVIPAVANAQLMPLQDDPSWGPRLRVTPFIGYLPSVTRNDTWIHSSPGSDVAFTEVEYEVASGTALGVNGEVVLRGPWSALGTIMYGSRGESRFDLIDSGQEFEINGSRYIFTRAGISLALREKDSDLMLRRLSASVFAAPFYMREIPRSELGFENLDVFNASNHFGVSLGAAGELPFARDRMSLQIAVEDYATWWNGGALKRLPDSFINDQTPGASTRVETSVSHMWLMRAGVSYRWK